MSRPLSLLTISLHQLHAGGWEATCGRCLARSTPILVSSTELAWTELQIQGWTGYRWSEGSSSYAVCPTCSEGNTERKPPRRRRR